MFHCLYAILLFIIFIGLPRSASATDTYECKLFQAYIKQNMQAWEEVITELSSSYQKTNDKEQLFALTYAQYGYSGYLIGEEKYDQAKRVIQKAQGHLSKLRKSKHCPSKAEALKAAFYAYEVAMNRSKTLYLGPKILNLIDKSIRLDSTCPFGWVEKGNAYYHMPGIFGGSYQKAINYYQKAIQLFETKPERLQCNWYYMNTLMWLAKSYENLERYDDRDRIFQKMLSIAPGFDKLRDWMDE